MMRPCKHCLCPNFTFEYVRETETTATIIATCKNCAREVMFPAKPKKNAGKVYPPPKTMWRPDDLGEGNRQEDVPWV